MNKFREAKKRQEQVTTDSADHEQGYVSELAAIDRIRKPVELHGVEVTSSSAQR